MAYTYDRLSGEQFATRLLEIVPVNNPDDPIEVHLKHVCLTSKPQYRALSYTWGRPAPHLPDEWDDPQSTKPIVVDGKILRIGYNLFSALQAIRHAWISDTLWWIDAICIDQNNISERNKQVANMREIYASSLETVVWLGPADGSTSTAFKKIASLSTSWEGRTEKLRNYSIDDEDINQYTDILRSDLAETDLVESWSAVLSLLSRSWFERTWVAQEILVASSVTIICGAYFTTWTELFNTNQLIAQHITSIRKAIDFNVSFASRLLWYLWINTKPWRNMNVMLIASENYKKAPPGIKLSYVLERLRQTHATDSRDKVYAAYGLTGIEERVLVDYSRPAEVVYTSITQRLIQVTRSLHLLAYCQYPPALANLPSWAVDWSDATRSDLSALPQKGVDHSCLLKEPLVYHTTLESEPWFRFDDDGRVLLVKGATIGEIAFVSSDCRIGFPESLQRTCLSLEDLIARHDEERNTYNTKNNGIIFEARWLREWAEVHSPLGFGSISSTAQSRWSYDPTRGNSMFEDLVYTLTDEALLEAYQKTLSADVIADFGDDPKVAELSIAKNIKDILSQDVQRRAAPLLLEGRAFAVSEQGLFSLVPAKSQVHDLIAIVQGSELPFILRPSKDGFLFIGQAYVHGIMDGEVWEAVENGEIPLKEISIV